MADMIDAPENYFRQLIPPRDSLLLELEQEAEQEDRQRLPAASLPDHDRPGLLRLPGAGRYRSESALADIVRPAGLLVPDHGHPSPHVLLATPWRGGGHRVLPLENLRGAARRTA